MKVIYQDQDVIVLDKPAGLAVQTTHDSNEPTVESWLRTQSIEPYLVHRLDKNTSGVLLVAKNSKTQAYLRQQFKERRVAKTYLALARGRVDEPEAHIDYPIARHAKNPLKRAVRASGKPAQSQYKVIKQYPEAALLEVQPKTGRTHQIRVHLAKIGHPVVGDHLYGQPEASLPRHFLHASQLRLKLPSGQSQTWEAPLPPELQAYLSNLV